MMPLQAAVLPALLLVFSVPAQDPVPAAASTQAAAPKVGELLATALLRGDSKSLAAAVDGVHKSGAEGRARLAALVERVAPAAKALPAAAAPDPKVMAEPLADDDRGLVEALAGADAEAAGAAGKKLLDAAATNAALVQKVGGRADALLGNYLLRVFREQEESRALFAGQYAMLRDLGAAGRQQLLVWLEKPPARMRADVVKTHCLRALRDVVEGKPDDALLAALGKVAKSVVESRNVTREAVFALAQFGDRSLVDPQITSLEERAKNADPAKSAAALAELADVHYQLRDFEKAAADYKRHIAILEANEAVAAANQNLPTLYYNACCSMALAGQLDEAFAHLEKGVDIGLKSGRPLMKRLLEVDMDIVSLRKDPRFAAVMKRVEAGK
jgi:tetratricopeptide (TPR) repeat protein